MSVSIRMECSVECAEVVGELGPGLGVTSVSIEYSTAGSLDGVPLLESAEGKIETEGRHCTLSLLLDEGVESRDLLASLQEILGWDRIPPYRVMTVERKDWVESVRRRLPPLRISRRLWIVPTWHQPPDPGAVNLRIDPGEAFGTGTHPTTRLCLEYLDRTIQPGDFVLDYGCGTGILAIAALKSGAGKAVGVDVDPLALKVSRANAARNGVKLPCYLPEECPPLTVDFILANILANPLEEMAFLLSGYARKGGRIVLSGLLVEQVSSVLSAYREWFEFSPPVTEAGWALLTGLRR